MVVHNEGENSMFNPQVFNGTQDLQAAAGACGCGCACSGGGAGGGSGSGDDSMQQL